MEKNSFSKYNAFTNVQKTEFHYLTNSFDLHITKSFDLKNKIRYETEI